MPFVGKGTIYRKLNTMKQDPKITITFEVGSKRKTVEIKLDKAYLDKVRKRVDTIGADDAEIRKVMLEFYTMVATNPWSMMSDMDYFNY